jgi:hypothetical protein
MPLVVGGAGAGLMGESETGPEAPFRFAGLQGALRWSEFSHPARPGDGLMSEAERGLSPLLPLLGGSDTEGAARERSGLWVVVPGAPSEKYCL